MTDHLRDFVNNVLGEPYTLRRFAAYRENPPEGAERRINGRTPLQRIEAVDDRRRQGIREHQRAGYDRLRERAVGEVQGDEEELREVLKALQGMRADLVAGRVGDIDKFMTDIADSFQVVRTVVAELDGIDTDAEAAAEHIDMDPADYEESLLKRFPAYADSLPVLTEAYLLGEEGALDPLAKAKDADAGHDQNRVAEFMRRAAEGRGRGGVDDDE